MGRCSFDGAYASQRVLLELGDQTTASHQRGTAAEMGSGGTCNGGERVRSMGTWASRFLLRCGGKSESCGMNRLLCPVLGFVYLGDEGLGMEPSRRLFLCFFRRILWRQPCSEAIRSAGCPTLTCRRTPSFPSLDWDDSLITKER